MIKLGKAPAKADKKLRTLLPDSIEILNIEESDRMWDHLRQRVSQVTHTDILEQWNPGPRSQSYLAEALDGKAQRVSKDFKPPVKDEFLLVGHLWRGFTGYNIPTSDFEFDFRLYPIHLIVLPYSSQRWLLYHFFDDEVDFNWFLTL